MLSILLKRMESHIVAMEKPYIVMIDTAEAPLLSRMNITTKNPYNVLVVTDSINNKTLMLSLV